MLFNTASYAIFFIAFFVLFHLVLKSHAAKLWLIALASALFYAMWDYRFLPLLIGTGFVDFTIAQAIHASDQARRRKLLLATSVSVNLGVLFFFKYSGFAISSARSLLALVGVSIPLPVMEVILPVGISFYTFQSISYIVDVYRGDFRPKKKFGEFFASLTFFPHLVAGPIIRSSQLLPQFERFRTGTSEMHARGLVLIAFGLLKKTVADLVAQPSERLFSSEAVHSVLEAWTGVIAFSAQIYCDFSGYTDIAIGSALLLGIVIPDNFNLPYLATSVVDFWKRWHISLSSWLRDYLYIPLGGNRRRRNLNLFLTMLLGGLWHGASITFIVWGAFHGALLVMTHFVQQRWGRAPEGAQFPVLVRIPQVILTFYLVTIGWVFFRAPSIGRALQIIREMHVPATPSVWGRNELVLLGLAMFALIFSHGLDAVARHGRIHLRASLLWPATCVGLAFAILLGGRGNAFIYFQF